MVNGLWYDFKLIDKYITQQCLHVHGIQKLKTCIICGYVNHIINVWKNINSKIKLRSSCSEGSVVSLVVMDTGEVKGKVLCCCFECILYHHGNCERPHPSGYGGYHPGHLADLMGETWEVEMSSNWWWCHNYLIKGYISHNLIIGQSRDSCGGR